MNMKTILKEKINIINYSDADYESFAKMFFDYFSNDIKTGDSFEIIKREVVDKQVLPFFKNQAIFINIAKIDDNPVGFIIYQIDSNKSDWCERPGEGFIRELYVDKNFRNKGLGGKLLVSAENNFRNLKVQKVYLTTDIKDYVKEFYLNKGYISENKLSKNNSEYMYKDLF